MPVIFDFDGVIADTEKLHFEASRLVLADEGMPLDQARYYAKYLGYSDADMAEAIARDQGRFAADGDRSEFVREFTRRKGVIFERLLTSGAILFPGVAACFERLAPVFPLAIASGSFHEEIERILNGAGLRHHFQAIVGAADAARSKPHPAPYLEAARRLGVPPSACVAIEDSMWGLDSARGAGMQTIAVTNSYSAAELTADRIVNGLDEVTPELIQEMLTASTN
jgi:beta-phosphoglucomutase-like phosphatase (HAD superfamily)